MLYQWSSTKLWIKAVNQKRVWHIHISTHLYNFFFSGSPCPPNWYHYPQGPTCYFVSDFQRDWTEAAVCIYIHLFLTLNTWIFKWEHLIFLYDSIFLWSDNCGRSLFVLFPLTIVLSVPLRFTLLITLLVSSNSYYLKIYLFLTVKLQLSDHKKIE
jgi:hypothetical protein